jgi:hypothetical protein
MAIEHQTFDKQKHPVAAPDHMKGAGYTDRCAECGHFYEEHVHPRTFCRCCNAGPQPLPAKDGHAFGFRSRTNFVEGAAGTIQGAEYPKHLMRYGASGEILTTVVQTPDGEKKARDAGYAASVKELGPNPVAKARAADTLEAKMQRATELEEILAGEAQDAEVPRETLERIIAQRNSYAQELADITKSLNAKPGEKK